MRQLSCINLLIDSFYLAVVQAQACNKYAWAVGIERLKFELIFLLLNLTLQERTIRTMQPLQNLCLQLTTWIKRGTPMNKGSRLHYFSTSFFKVCTGKHLLVSYQITLIQKKNANKPFMWITMRGRLEFLRKDSKSGNISFLLLELTMQPLQNLWPETRKKKVFLWPRMQTCTNVEQFMENSHWPVLYVTWGMLYAGHLEQASWKSVWKTMLTVLMLKETLPSKNTVCN